MDSSKALKSAAKPHATRFAGFGAPASAPAARSANERAGRDRRAFERRHDAAEEVAVQGGDLGLFDTRFTVPRRWGEFGLWFALAFALCALVAQRLPDTAQILAAAGAIATLALSRLFARVERRIDTDDARGFSKRLGIAVAAIGAPLALGGWAIGSLVAQGLAWPWAVATMLCLSAAQSALLGHRVSALLASNFVFWLGFAAPLIDAQLALAIAGATVALLLLARRQIRLERRARSQALMRERMRARAEEILKVHESAGLGWFWETDRRGLISYISPSFAQAIGRAMSDLIGTPFARLFLAEGADAAEAQRSAAELQFHLDARADFTELEVQSLDRDKAPRYWAISGKPNFDALGNFCGYRGSGIDLTQKRLSEQEAQYLSRYDPLTGLSNRREMFALLDRVIEASRERAGSGCAVMMLDLDRFKQVNDTLGHLAGDALLREVAGRIEAVIGARGRCGRLGGDEFMVVLPQGASKAELADLARALIARLSQPYLIEGNRVVIGASVGIALAEAVEAGEASGDAEAGDKGHSTSGAQAMMRNADLALYAAKDQGRGVHAFFTPRLQAMASRRAQLEGELRAAIDKDELQLHFQPVVEIASERIVGFEALLRWPHRERGLIAPDEFIPVAEQSGLIETLGQWVIERACAQLAQWPEPLFCAINVSPRQLSNPDFPATLRRAIAAHGLAPSRIELELTESLFLEAGDDRRALFEQLKSIGVRLALDDFGTGYSSLGYLQHAPFDKLKIDRSFVAAACDPDHPNAKIISAIIALADALGMQTTAEGVETSEALELMRQLGARQVQGTVYCGALAVEEAEAMIEDTGPLAVRTAASPRPARKSVLRRVVLRVGEREYRATMRNCSKNGALIEGVRKFAPGTRVWVDLGEGPPRKAQVRWSRPGALGCAFEAGDAPEEPKRASL